MVPFLDSLAREDLAPATLRGYRYDLRHFLAWHATVQPDAFALDHLAAFELVAYRQHMVAAGRRPATINRRLDALRRLCRWARSTGTLSGDVVHDLRPVRTVRNRQPAGRSDRSRSSRTAARCRGFDPRPRRAQLCAGPGDAAGRAARRRSGGAAGGRYRPERPVPAWCASATAKASKPARCR